MKRFSETTKWDDPWFRKLKPRYKAFLQYIWDRCDSAGVWVVDLDLAITYVGEKIEPKEALRVFDGRVVDGGDGKWLVPGFIPFQYGDLTHECKPHRPILKLVEKHGLEKNGKGYRKGINTLSDTLEEKEKEKEKDSLPGLVLPAPVPDTDEDALAEEIYELYPLKAGKPGALRAIRKALKERDSIFLRERTAAYAKAVDGTETLIPHPATWFNDERYNDDPSTWVRKQLRRERTPSELRAAKDLIEAQMAALKRKHHSDTEGLRGGEYLPAGWRNEPARMEYVKLKRERDDLNDQLVRAT